MSRASSPAFAIGGITFDPETEMYEIPPFGWRCFHCNEHFMDPRAAQLHFGADPEAHPACLIKGHFDGDMLKALRELERESIETIAGLQRELGQAEGEYYGSLQSLSSATMLAEEQGYARGLADGRKERAGA